METSHSDSSLPVEHRQQKTALQTRNEYDALVEAIQRLETALASAAPGRERDWNERVVENLRAVANLLEEHVRSADAADGLLADIETTRPALLHRVERLRQEHRNLLQQTRALHRQIEHLGEGELPDFRDVRHRTTWLLNYLRHHQAIEADLIFEAFCRDVGVGD